MLFLKTLLLLYCTLCLFPSITFSQQLQVKNVRFESAGEIVKIHYDLFGEPGKRYKISLKLSENNGYTYNIRPKMISGDVGKNISVGKNKEVEWHMHKDFPSGLTGDEFVFAVDAELQKGRKWPYYLLGTGVVASAAFLYLTQPKEENPTTGSIIIDIPN